MKPPWVRFLIFACLLGVLAVLLVLFPAALRFVEMAAVEARYLWWLILMVVLGVWLIWGFGKSSK
jgi:hypothetical protein